MFEEWQEEHRPLVPQELRVLEEIQGQPVRRAWVEPQAMQELPEQEEPQGQEVLLEQEERQALGELRGRLVRQELQGQPEPLVQ